MAASDYEDVHISKDTFESATTGDYGVIDDLKERIAKGGRVILNDEAGTQIGELQIDANGNLVFKRV